MAWWAQWVVHSVLDALMEHYGFLDSHSARATNDINDADESMLRRCRNSFSLTAVDE